MNDLSTTSAKASREVAFLPGSGCRWDAGAETARGKVFYVCGESSKTGCFGADRK